MYAESGSAVLLGVPTGVVSVRSEIGSSETAATNKIGGLAVWHDAMSAPCLEDLACGVCGSVDSVALVAQLYVPVYSIDRSLYVFGCNKRVCASRCEGWKVIRNQKASDDNSADVTPPPAPEVASKANSGGMWGDLMSESTAPKANAGGMWGDLMSESTAPKANAGGMWGDLTSETSNSGLGNLLASNDEVAQEDDLLALLAARDLSLETSKNTTQTKVTPAQPKLAVVSEDCILRTKLVLPRIFLSDEDEPWDEETETLALSGDIDLGDSSADVTRLLRDYFRDEDDTIQAAALAKHGIDISKGDSLSVAAIQAALASVSYSSKTEPPPTTAANDGEDSDDIKDVDDDVVISQKYSNMTTKQKETYFQTRVSAEPKQVMRYAYEGLPLWPFFPAPVEANRIPVCESCNTNRVFEFQLMPQLLSVIEPHLMASQSSNASEGASAPQQQARTTEELKLALAQRLGSGMDFSSLCVWSCPNSCNHRRGGISEEYIVVQPPADLTS